MCTSLLLNTRKGIFSPGCQQHASLSCFFSPCPHGDYAWQTQPSWEGGGEVSALPACSPLWMGLLQSLPPASPTAVPALKVQELLLLKSGLRNECLPRTNSFSAPCAPARCHPAWCCRLAAATTSGPCTAEGPLLCPGVPLEPLIPHCH